LAANGCSSYNSITAEDPGACGWERLFWVSGLVLGLAGLGLPSYSGSEMEARTSDAALKPAAFHMVSLIYALALERA